MNFYMWAQCPDCSWTGDKAKEGHTYCEKCGCRCEIFLNDALDGDRDTE